MLLHLPENPSPEQLPILLTDTFTTSIIRGAAGSGKTASAAFRVRKAVAGLSAQHTIDADDRPVRALVLTFNRTLCGYINEFLSRDTQRTGRTIDVTVSTFAGWVQADCDYRDVIDDKQRSQKIKDLWARARGTSRLASLFVINEVTYILGRYDRGQLQQYIGASREGRGNPSLQASQRHLILNGVLKPYLEYLEIHSLLDWSDIPALMIANHDLEPYDIIVVDEVQDFSVQQLRTIAVKLRDCRSLTMVIDSGQKIYPHVIYWDETGLDLSAAVEHRLSINFRNTTQVAQFVQPLLNGMRMDADGTLPDYQNCKNLEIGRTPELYIGRFSEQVAYTISQILSRIDLATESVGILTLWGDTKGQIQRTLTEAGIAHVPLTKERTWPTGPQNVAHSTLHSAKGLEFDHVFILGFDSEFLDPYETDPDDSDYSRQRRLLAMALMRARKSVVIGYRDNYRSGILDLLDPNTYIIRRPRG